MGLPDLNNKKKGKQKAAKETHVAEALDKLREQTREAVKGLESLSKQPPGAADDAMMEDWVKQFEELAGSKVRFYCLIIQGYSSFFEFLMHWASSLPALCYAIVSKNSSFQQLALFGFVNFLLLNSDCLEF